VQVGLNKGEAKNALARAVFFNRLGELRDRSFENQRYRASGLNLVVAAIVLWNTVYLERAIKGLREAGQLCTYQREQPCLLAHRQLWMPLAGSLLTGGNFCFLEQLCAAGSGPGTHAHPSDEGLYVVGGHCTFHAGGETVEAGPGTFSSVPRLVEHSFTVDEPKYSRFTEILGMKVPCSASLQSI
jgi:quercetin dioxygenase-like cupin family protein